MHAGTFYIYINRTWITPIWRKHVPNIEALRDETLEDMLEEMSNFRDAVRSLPDQANVDGALQAIEFLGASSTVRLRPRAR